MKKFDLKGKFTEFIKILNRKESNIDYNRRCDMYTGYIAGCTQVLSYLKNIHQKGYNENEIGEAINDLYAELLLTPDSL